MRFGVVICLVVSLVCGITAINSSELDYSDPYLLDKIINKTIVVDPPNYHKRQSTVLARMYSDNNLSGGIVYDITTTNTQVKPTVIGSPYGVSSVQLYDPSYILVLYDDAGCTSTNRRYFRTTFPINYLADQDNFGDKTACAEVIYIGARINSATIWEGSDFSKRATYLLTGSYPSITATTGYRPYLRNDQQSALEVYPGVRLQMWSDSNYGGSYSGYLPATVSTYPYYLSTMSFISYCNDCLSSFVLA